MTAWLTLATGLDRWEEDHGRYRLKAEGKLWVLVWPDDGASRMTASVILKPEEANWCFETLRAYRIVEHIPSKLVGPQGDDSWRIEFQHDGDMLLFKAMWGEQ